MRKQNKKSKKQNIEINYLDLIPVRSEELHWHKDIKGRVILDVENTGWFNKIAQTVFNKPQYTKVHLDAQGTFIWPLIDGKRTVTDIAALVKEEFGEAAEPLYPRIIKYFQIVESYHFIKFAKQIHKPHGQQNTYLAFHLFRTAFYSSSGDDYRSYFLTG